MTYGLAFENYCARYGREVDTSIATFKNRICSRSGNPVPDPDHTRRLQVQILINPGVPRNLGAVVPQRARESFQVPILVRRSARTNTCLQRIACVSRVFC